MALKTKLYNEYKSLAKGFVEFAHYLLPSHFSSVREENLAVRESCGIFDVSHMGRIKVKANKEKLQKIFTNDLNKIKEGKVLYGFIPSKRGGVLDDITLYQLKDEEFLMVVNAVNREKVKNFLKEVGINFEDLTQNFIQIAVQGKESEKILKEVLNLPPIKYYHFKEVDGFLISRTGYTGSDGFEVFGSWKEVRELFKELLKLCKPCGLMARNVLRIEAGLPLYGNELREDLSPLCSNLGKFVKFEKKFLFWEEMKRKGCKERLYLFEVEGRRFPRRGFKVYSKEKEVGYISSSTYSYYLKRGIGFLFLREGEGELYSNISGQRINLRLVKERWIRRS